MVMPDSREDIVGPQLLVLPNGTSRYFDSPMHIRVTARSENLREGVVVIDPALLNTVELTDPDGFKFRLYLWHFRLVVLDD